MTYPHQKPSPTVPSTRSRQRLRSRDWPHPPRRDPHVRLLARLMELAGPDMSIVASSSRPWASATFIGAQHRAILRFAGAGAGGDAAECAARFAEALPEAEFAISGHIVADACVDEWRQDTDAADQDCSDESQQCQTKGLTLRVSILTVEDW